mmetsp:Transcript_41824/g.110268  ORF Transcript_41824/g.110268 Transcript_41824/m.110268 type:complete len:106 (-) Transcript_41824:280-597(-)
MTAHTFEMAFSNPYRLLLMIVMRVIVLWLCCCTKKARCLLLLTSAVHGQLVTTSVIVLLPSLNAAGACLAMSSLQHCKDMTHLMRSLQQPLRWPMISSAGHAAAT